jgi:PAS domain S-box-containing protein
MAEIEAFPVAARRLSEFDALVAAAPSVLDAIPGAVYLCDRDGWVVRYNREAAELWGRKPQDAHRDRYCGSLRLYLPDGRLLEHADCPMADAVRTGATTRNAEVVIERPNGERITALVNIRALRDHHGEIQGAINCFQDITARKEIDRKSLQQAADLDDFFENSAVALHIVNAEGIIVRANKAELDMLGYRPDEYIGQPIAKFHAEAAVIEDILQRLCSGKALVRYPARLRAKDGSLRHVEITSTPRIVDGVFKNTRCFTTDVTERLEAQRAKEEAQERLAATYEAASVGIGEVDEDGRFLRVNDALCAIVGRTPEELLGATFDIYTHPDDRPEDRRNYVEQVTGRKRSYALHKRGVKPDGSMVHLQIFSSSVRNPDGTFRHGVRIVQDVSEAKRLEERLRNAESHFRTLLEAIPAAIYTTDANGKITFFNKAAVEMAGRVPAPGDEWCVTWRLFNTDGTPLPHDQCPMAVALKEDRTVRGAEAIAERPDGTRVPFIPFPTPLHDQSGKLVGAINMLVDITERKKAEVRQKNLIDELNHRVKNTLASVQSLALQTARHAPDVDAFIRDFQARLLALARAHDLLSKRYWQDAPLEQLLREVLLPLAGKPDQIRFAGPSLTITPRVALSLTMTLNELGTNAVKYGALSGEAGRLSLAWTAENANFTLDWAEEGGPMVTPPSRRGFGTRLMERCVEADLAGNFDLTYAPQGVRCQMTIPMATAQPAQTS